MITDRILKPGDRDSWSRLFLVKLLLCIAFTFWIYQSLKVQPSLQGAKWSTMSIAVALAFGIVTLTYMAAKSWMNPDNLGEPDFKCWLYTLLAALVCMADIYFVHQRLEVQSSGFFLSSGSDGPLFSYMVSGVLLVVNLAVSVAMASAWYKSGLAEEGLKTDAENTRLAFQRKKKHLQVAMARLKAFVHSNQQNLDNAKLDQDHRNALKGNQREAERALSDAEMLMVLEEAEEMRLAAESKSLRNNLRRQYHDRLRRQTEHHHRQNNHTNDPANDQIGVVLPFVQEKEEPEND